MIKCICYAILFYLMTASALANVVELDNKNNEHCRQQLLASSDYNPVVFIYAGDAATKAIYEKLASETPKRSFYAYDLGNSTAVVSQACLGRVPLALPAVDVYQINFHESPHEFVGLLKSTVNLTKAEMEKAIVVNPKEHLFVFVR